MIIGEIEVLRWLHILAMVYWLGGEWGVFQTSYNVVNPRLSLDERRRRRTRGLVPVVGCLIAGVAVLLYGVSLFRPMAGFADFLAAKR